MIISASRRTDIPSYYLEWFLGRLKEEYVLVRNPMNFHQISRVSLSPEVVDGIVFWTKNPVPMLGRLEELESFSCPYYIQFTLTAYGPEVEQNLPSKNQVLIPVFRKLAREIGPERMIWRYDPIFLSERYSLEYHCRYFAVLASRLASCTRRCTVSFLDWYRKTRRNANDLGIIDISREQQLELLGRLAEIAGNHGIAVDICGEAGDFGSVGVGQAHCIDRELLERIGNYKLEIGKDKNQRAECGCASSIDIGAYDTCRNGCLYCYANENMALAGRNHQSADPGSPLLLGSVGEKDVVSRRKVRSYADRQISMLDNI